MKQGVTAGEIVRLAIWYGVPVAMLVLLLTLGLWSEKEINSVCGDDPAFATQGDFACIRSDGVLYRPDKVRH